MVKPTAFFNSFPRVFIKSNKFVGPYSKTSQIVLVCCAVNQRLSSFFHFMSSSITQIVLELDWHTQICTRPGRNKQTTKNYTQRLVRSVDLMAKW